MSLEQVVNLLESTVQGTQEQITKATQVLEWTAESNFGQLLLSLSLVLSNETLSSVSRQQAALFIKNSLYGGSAQFRERKAAKWAALDPKAQSTIKGHVLNTLITKDRQVANQAAQAVAALAMLELPHERWPDLIQNLCSACDAKNSDELKEAALKTIGYICKEIDDNLIVDKIAMILTAVVNNMTSANPKVAAAAVEALENMVIFLHPVFQVKAQRDALMTRIFQCCSSTDDEMKAKGISLLTDVINEYYPYMADYMQAVYQMTMPIIEQSKEDDEVVKQAIDVWITIADIETEKAMNEEDAARDGGVVDDLDKSRRYVEGAMLPLLKALFTPLTKQDPDADDDEWNVSHAAATCISYMATCVQDKIVPPVVELFKANITNTDWRIRDAATVVFGSILDGPSTDSLKPFAGDASLLNLFLEHMKDSNSVVRCSTAWTLGRMCEFQVDIVVTDTQRLVSILNSFKEGLKDEDAVAIMCAWGIMTLAEALDDLIKRRGISQANPLALHFNDLVTALFTSGEKRGCSPKQRKGTYQALCALVRCSTSECIPQVAQVTMMCLDRIMTMTSVENPSDKKDADELEALISGLMTECVIKLERNIAQIADRVCEAYLTLYSKGHGATSQEEAVLGLGSFAQAMGKGIEPYADRIAAVLKECVLKPEELDVCKVALGSIGDLARALEEGFGRFVPVFVPILAPLLNPRYDRSLFSPLLSTFGDIAQFATKEFAQYIPQTVAVVQQAMASKVDMDDEDEKDFLFDLQESGFSCIAGIQSGLTTLKMSRNILSLSGTIVDCIKLAYGYMMRPESLSNAIVGAICDLVIAAGAQVKKAIAPGMPWEEFPSMIQTIEKNATEAMTKENCRYAEEKIRHFLQG